MKKLSDEDLAKVTGGSEVVVTGGDDEDYFVDEVSVLRPFNKEQ